MSRALASQIELKDFPQFENPPVVETVLSVQYEPLQQLSPVHFGLYWQRIRDHYPFSEEHPPLPPQMEQSKAAVAGMRFELGCDFRLLMRTVSG